MNLVSLEQALDAFDPVIGLEVHVELNTQSKMFSPAPNPAASLEEYAPNTAISPVCLGLPGSLPVVNAEAVRSSIALGLALGCEIAPTSRFARKNYFYPDLAKNYQISQYDEPIAHDGSVEVELDDQTLWTVEIERAHMEEDAGKLSHVGGETGVFTGPNTRWSITTARECLSWKSSPGPLLAPARGPQNWHGPTSRPLETSSWPSECLRRAWSEETCAVTPTCL